MRPLDAQQDQPSCQILVASARTLKAHGIGHANLHINPKDYHYQY